MAVIATYNSKGGVGKTTFAINLAWEAVQNGYRTLLWELDEQGDSSWMMVNGHQIAPTNAVNFSMGIANVRQQIRLSKFPKLSLLAGDANIRATENFLVSFAKQQRLSKLFSELEEEFDLIILDCPPGFSEANRRIMQFAHLVIVPVVPSPLAMRGFYKIRDYMRLKRGHHPPMLPVFSMVDRRRKMHKLAMEEHPNWPVVSIASDIERMTDKKLPIGAFASKSKSGGAFRELWRGVEHKLLKMLVLRKIVASKQMENA
ncbi:ParA family protein [Parasphingorhabdus sp.]|uniref:ParA family protein n=1 Tax=Parasphingorhabdus sp. TaxID=2709688 RepID=UPI003D2CC144